ncbi:MAG TPA: glycosyltransferase family 39 protein [Chthonomonadaceae bacterium]|nr:glycosyltransferase family 39 protein [Chthonomonadaceae bacterium]
MSPLPSRKSRLKDSGPPLSPLPPPLKSPGRAWRWALPALLLLYLGLAVAHAWSVPTGNTGYQDAPDEAAHVAYAQALAAGHLPTQEQANLDPKKQSYEWHQPPLYYLLARCFLMFGLKGMRAVSILCGLVGILLIYGAGRLLLPDYPLVGIVAAGIAALTPTHIAITSTVNNDSLLEVCFSGVLLLWIHALRSGFTLWRAGWIGIVIGAAILTKMTGLLLLPLALLALALLWRNGEPAAEIGRGALWMLLLTAIVCGWWFVRDWRLYGQWVPVGAFSSAFSGTVRAQDVVAGQIPIPGADSWPGYVWLTLRWTFMSFWAVYGTPLSAQVGAPRFLPDQAYWLMGLVCALAFGGLLKLHRERKTAFTEVQRYGLWLLFATIGVVGLSLSLFLKQYFQPQGRYLYPALLPICLLLALGWRTVFPQRYADLASGGLLALLAALALAFLRYVLP